MKIFKNYILMGLLISIFYTFEAIAQIQVIAEPNEVNPRTILISNDSLAMKISIDNKLEVSSLKFLITDTEFVQQSKPMPLVQIDNPWILHNVDYTIQSAQIRETKDSAIVNISAFSNYIENPFHLFIKIAIANKAKIDISIKLKNDYKEGFTDIYRHGGAKVTPGIPWLSFLEPNPGGARKIIYPISSEWKEGIPSDGTYVLEEFNEPFTKVNAPTEDEYIQPHRVPVLLEFYDKPMLPIIMEYSDINLGLFIYKDKSAINWKFDNKEKALWPSSRVGIEAGEEIVIFDGTIGFFQGDWHSGFNWFRQLIRKDFDFTYYQRPSCEKFRKDFTGFHSFIFNHRLYDPVNNKYRIKEFLKESIDEYGGFDQFYFWHAYPRVGSDPRDQFDLFYDLPGGLDSLKSFIEIAHSLGTHVYLAYNPWDVIGNKSDMYAEMTKIVGKVGADGLLLDTMGESDLDLRTKMDVYNPDAQFVTEGRPSLEGLVVTTSSWDHKLTKDPMPYVDLLRFIIPEHRTFTINRFDRDRELLIKKAIFNMTGYTVWDDIFGEINLHSWEEKILISRFQTIMKDFSQAINSSSNEPLINTFLPALYVNGSFSKEMHFYTLYHDMHNFVSRHRENRVIGSLFPVDIPDGWHMIDVWNKRPVSIRKIQGEKVVFLPNEMVDNIGCFAAMPERIKITQDKDIWKAEIDDQSNYQLELIGSDIGMRNQIVKVAEKGTSLIFDSKTAKATSEGYVLVQLKNEKEEVIDAVYVNVGF